VASVGLIVGRQAHPSFGSKFIVSLVEPQPNALAVRVAHHELEHR
jgi:hypothetical protein